MHNFIAISVNKGNKERKKKLLIKERKTMKRDNIKEYIYIRNVPSVNTKKHLIWRQSKINQ